MITSNDHDQYLPVNIVNTLLTCERIPEELLNGRTSGSERELRDRRTCRNPHASFSTRLDDGKMAVNRSNIIQ